jgi:hypothetical protein
VNLFPDALDLSLSRRLHRAGGGKNERGGEATMKNVEMTVEGTMLTIKVDLSKEFGPSSSGKTIIIASTEGNVTIPNREEKVGLNVYRKKS